MSILNIFNARTDTETWHDIYHEISRNTGTHRHFHKILPPFLNQGQVVSPTPNPPAWRTGECIYLTHRFYLPGEYTPHRHSSQHRVHKLLHHDKVVVHGEVRSIYNLWMGHELVVCCARNWHQNKDHVLARGLKGLSCRPLADFRGMAKICISGRNHSVDNAAMQLRISQKSMILSLKTQHCSVN